MDIIFSISNEGNTTSNESFLPDNHFRKKEKQNKTKIRLNFNIYIERESVDSHTFIFVLFSGVMFTLKHSRPC